MQSAGAKTSLDLPCFLHLMRTCASTYVNDRDRDIHQLVQPVSIKSAYIT